MSETALRSALDKVQVWTNDALARLVAVRSVTGQPSEIMDVLDPMLSELGLVVSRIPVDPPAVTDYPEFCPPLAVEGEQPPALHATDSSTAGSPELLLFAHTDTEPVHAGWDGDPFTIRLDGDRAYGLGVCDDKAGVVSILAAVRALRLAGLTPSWRPRIVLGSGKQGGSLGTLQGVAAAVGVRGAVYSHPAESGAGLAHLKVASRGIVSIRVVVHGQPPEPVEIRTPVSADPRRGHNAAVRAAQLASAVRSWTHPGEVWAVVGIDCPARPYEVPAAAAVELACWFTDGTVEEVVSRAGDRLLASATDDWERRHPPVATVHGIRANPASCADSVFARRAAVVVHCVTRRPVEDYGWHSASDIRFPMRLLEVPAVGFGATAGGFYGPGEWVDVPSMHAATEAVARMLLTDPDT